MPLLGTDSTISRQQTYIGSGRTYQLSSRERTRLNKSSVPQEPLATTDVRITTDGGSSNNGGT